MRLLCRWDLHVQKMDPGGRDALSGVKQLISVICSGALSHEIMADVTGFI